MIEPKWNETPEDWLKRTSPECKEGQGEDKELELTDEELERLVKERLVKLRYKEGETIAYGIPLEGGRSIYTFEGAPTEDQIKEYFDELYSEPGSNYWGVKEVKVVKMDGRPAYSIQLDRRHDL